MVARWAHNPKVAGSSPAPATSQGCSGILFLDMDIIYEDNHILVVNKAPGEIVQGDKTGDTPIVEKLKQYLKEKYNKPGNVFCGVVHRIDRPVGGLVIFAKTSKALTRLNDMLRKGEIHKTYRALVTGFPEHESATLENYIISDGTRNKSYITDSSKPGAKMSRLDYKVIERGERYSLLEIELHTGRKHQIRVQLSATGHPIKGDLKYGARRSNPDGSISLQAWRLEFTHPVSRQRMVFEVASPLSL